jgi:hypothetical protein
MIDRKTALICAGLVALMFAAAFWRITSSEAWPAQMAWTRTLLPSVKLFVFPAASALFTSSLYWNWSFRASADNPKFAPWQRWARWASISFCVGFSLMQGVLVAQSLALHPPFAIDRIFAVLVMIVALLALNQMPKLPWFERRFSLGGELGPVYGPRFIRILSKALIVFLIAGFAFAFTAPAPLAQRSFPYILGATALFLLCSIAWRIRLGRKWRLERAAHG